MKKKIRKSDGLVGINFQSNAHTLKYFFKYFKIQSFNFMHKLKKRIEVMIDIDGCISIFYATSTFNFT